MLLNCYAKIYKHKNIKHTTLFLFYLRFYENFSGFDHNEYFNNCSICMLPVNGKQYIAYSINAFDKLLLPKWRINICL